MSNANNGNGPTLQEPAPTPVWRLDNAMALDDELVVRRLRLQALQQRAEDDGNEAA